MHAAVITMEAVAHEAARIYVFILTKYQMTTWKQCDNVDEVAFSDEPAENYPLILLYCKFNASLILLLSVENRN